MYLTFIPKSISILWFFVSKYVELPSEPLASTLTFIIATTEEDL